MLGIISYGRDWIEKNGTIITNNKNITLRVYVGCKNSDKIPVPRVVSMADVYIIVLRRPHAWTVRPHQWHLLEEVIP